MNPEDIFKNPIKDNLEDKPNKPDQTIIESEVKDFKADRLEGLINQLRDLKGLQGSVFYSFEDLNRRITSVSERFGAERDLSDEKRKEILQDIPRARGLRQLVGKLLDEHRERLKPLPAISGATSFGDLEKKLKEEVLMLPSASDGSKFYTADQLIKNINDARAGKLNIGLITPVGGLRDQVMKLLAEEFKKKREAELKKTEDIKNDINKTVKY